jgi:antitoxin Phd
MTSQTSQLIRGTTLPKTAKKPSTHPRNSEARSLQQPAATWQVQTAKARFSELFQRARTEGPQRITRQGREAVVMIADEQYERLIGTANQPKSLLQFFRQSPLVGLDLNFDRDRDEGRDIDL